MRRRIYIFVFLLMLGEALLFSVNSPFIVKLVGEDLVGTLYSLSSLGAILLLALLPIFIRRSSPAKILTTLILVAAAAALLVGYGNSLWTIGALVIFLVIPQVAPAVSDIFIEKSSRVAERGSVVGTELTFMNLAFVIAPIIAGWIIVSHGFNVLYTISGVIFLLALFASLTFIAKNKPSHTHPGNLWRGIASAWTRKDLRYVLITQFLLQLFFSWMIIYTPLYLIDKFGFGFETLGIIFSIMLLPYILLEYPLGKIADNKLGEKELLSCGFVLMAITVGVIPFITSGAAWVWVVILFGTRVGAAMVEGMSAIYFFKKVEAKDIDLLALFRDMRPLAYLIGPIVASVIIADGSMISLFPTLSILMILGALTATRLHDTK